MSHELRFSEDRIRRALNVYPYYDLKSFSYDYSTKRILYKGKEFEPKLEHLNFLYHVCDSLRQETNNPDATVTFNLRAFQNVVYHIARMNSPKPQAEDDILLAPIEAWLTKTAKTETSAYEIIKEVFDGKLGDYSKRGLEIRIARCLKTLGFKKVELRLKNVWVKSKEETASTTEVDIFAGVD